MDKKVKIAFNVIAIVCIVLFSASLVQKTLQNDTFYTIKIGEHILQNGVDMQDPFSIHDLPYTYPHWAYDVAIYLIYSIGGMTGIYISTIILSCILGVTIYVTNKKITKNDLTSFILTFGAMYVLSDFITARAQLVTYILFTLQILFIEKFIETKKKRYAFGLLIIPIIIANVHLAVWPFYFVPFLPYIAEYLIAVILDSHLIHKISKFILDRKIKKLSKKDNAQQKIEELKKVIEDKEKAFELYKEKQLNRRNNPYKLKIEKKDAVKWLILIAIICILTGLLTPVGDAPYTYLIKTMQGNTTKNINEHLPMVLIESKYTLTLIVVLLAILIFTDTKIRLKDFFMLGGLILLALMSRRQLSMLILLGIYSINILICNLFEKYDPTGTEKFIKAIASGFGRVITILLVVLICMVMYKPNIKAEYINESLYPVAATEFIKENLNLEEIRLYNEYNYGSYLLFQGVPVFIDSRADLYTPQFNGYEDIFTDFLHVSSVSIHYEEIFDEYEITHLIIPNNTKINLFIKNDENYNQLYKDDNFVVYERLKK